LNENSVRDRIKWGLRWGALALFVIVLALVWAIRGYN
jgi:hypothetical protein